MTVVEITHFHRKRRTERLDGGLHADLTDTTFLRTEEGRAVVARVDANTDPGMPGRHQHVQRIALDVLRARGYRPITEEVA